MLWAQTPTGGDNSGQTNPRTCQVKVTCWERKAKRPQRTPPPVLRELANETRCETCVNSGVKSASQLSLQWNQLDLVLLTAWPQGHMRNDEKESRDMHVWDPEGGGKKGL